MSAPIRSAVLVLAVLAAIPASARAADEPKPFEGKANVGYVQTGGNTEVLTLLGSDKLEWRKSAWDFTQNAGAVYGRDAGVENAGRYEVGLRADYALATRTSAYALSTWKKNVFGGIVRQFDEGAGAVFHAIMPKPQLLDLELGLGLVQRRTTINTDENYSTGRLAAVYEYYFTEKATLEVTGSWVLDLEDSDNSDINGRAKLAAPIAGALALSLGYDAAYRTRPLPGLERLDWTVSAGLQFTL